MATVGQQQAKTAEDLPCGALGQGQIDEVLLEATAAGVIDKAQLATLCRAFIAAADKAWLAQVGR